MKKTRNIIEIDEELCNGCGLCVPDCAEGSLKIINGKAKLVADNLCDGLGACLGSCPTGALKIIEREAEDFDEEAVKEYLEKEAVTEKVSNHGGNGGGCPSKALHTFNTIQSPTPCQSANNLTNLDAGETSLLSHWPIQIRLVPPNAPFLQNAELLIAADCTAIAVRSFQEKYLGNNKVMMGCPKFDDAESYIQKFADIIKQSNLKSITILIMEVPCCSSMNVILKKALDLAGTKVPVEQITISLQGEEISRQSW